MARPYGEKIREVCAHMARANPEYRHPFLIAREQVKSVGVVIVTSDKGLCGGLNTNALRLAAERARMWESEGKRVSYTIFGAKGAAFLSRFGADILSQASGIGDAPRLEKLVGAVKAMLDAFESEKADEVHLIYTQFFNTVKQEAVMEQLLPLTDAMLQSEKSPFSWDYIYEPEAKSDCEYSSHPLYGGGDLSGGVRQHRIGAVGPNGGDESRHRQRRQSH